MTHDPASVPYPDDLVVLAPRQLEGRLFAAPNDTLGIGLQIRDDKLGNFLLALTPDQIAFTHRFLGELMALSPDEIVALRDRARAANEDDGDAQ